MHRQRLLFFLVLMCWVFCSFWPWFDTQYFQRVSGLYGSFPYRLYMQVLPKRLENCWSSLVHKLFCLHSAARLAQMDYQIRLSALYAGGAGVRTAVQGVRVFYEGLATQCSSGDLALFHELVSSHVKTKPLAKQSRAALAFKLLCWRGIKAVKYSISFGLLSLVVLLFPLVVELSVLFVLCRSSGFLVRFGVAAGRTLAFLSVVLRAWIEVRSFSAEVGHLRHAAWLVRKLFWSYLPYPASFMHHSGYTGGLFFHLVNTARYALRAAKDVCLASEDADVVVCAALLHDVGRAAGMVYQGLTSRWDGRGGTVGFLRYLMVSKDTSPHRWVSMGSNYLQHPQEGASVAAELIGPRDAVFSSRVCDLVIKHHAENPKGNRLLEILIRADRFAAGEETQELRSVVAACIEAVIRSATPNILVDGKVFMVWADNMPDILWVNPYMLRDKVIEFASLQGLVFPHVLNTARGTNIDLIVIEALKEHGLTVDLPVADSRTGYVKIVLGKVEFTLLPLKVHKLFTPDEVKRFPVYPYALSLVKNILECSEGKPSEYALSADVPKAAQMEDIQVAGQGEDQPNRLQALVRLWYEMFGTEPVLVGQVQALVEQLNLPVDLRRGGRAAAVFLKKLDGLEVSGIGTVRVEKLKKKDRVLLRLVFTSPPASKRQPEDHALQKPAATPGPKPYAPTHAPKGKSTPLIFKKKRPSKGV